MMKGMAAEQRREHGLRPTQASTFFCMHLDEKNMLTSAGTTAPVLFFTAGYREASKSLASMADVAFPMLALSRKSLNFGLTSSSSSAPFAGANPNADAIKIEK